jgi:hypothetical protein
MTTGTATGLPSGGIHVTMASRRAITCMHTGSWAICKQGALELGSSVALLLLAPRQRRVGERHSRVFLGGALRCLACSGSRERGILDRRLRIGSFADRTGTKHSGIRPRTSSSRFYFDIARCQYCLAPSTPTHECRQPAARPQGKQLHSTPPRTPAPARSRC